MRHPDEMDIIGTRPRPRLEELPLWRSAAPPPPIELRTPADYAKLAVQSRDGMQLLERARLYVNAILNAQRSVAVWEVRIAMGQRKELAIDGKEKHAAFGGLYTGMGHVAVDRERPPAWAQTILEKSHANVAAVWVRPPDVALYDRLERQRRTAA